MYKTFCGLVRGSVSQCRRVGVAFYVIHISLEMAGAIGRNEMSSRSRRDLSKRSSRDTVSELRHARSNESKRTPRPFAAGIKRALTIPARSPIRLAETGTSRRDADLFAEASPPAPPLS